MKLRSDADRVHRPAGGEAFLRKVKSAVKPP